MKCKSQFLLVALMAFAVSASAFIDSAASNRIGFYNAEGKPITFGFDAQGRITAITNAIGKVTSFAYDLTGNMISRQDAKAQSTVYQYSSMNRLTNIVHQGIWKASFAHDLAGNLINQQSPIGNQQFSYDSMNRLASSLISVNSRTFAITNSYDLNGNRTNITYPGGLTVGYEYDEENRLKKVIANRANLTNQFSFGYDSASRLTSMSYPNGVNSSFGYDAENRVTSLSHGSFINRAITRDARGYKTGENIITGLEPVMTNGQQKLTHNAADQLTHIDQRDTWFGGELNQWYNRDYTYDLNGNLAREAVTRPSWNTNTAIPEYTVNYTNDYDNRLSSVTSATSVVNYLYDASGSRIGRIYNSVTNYVTNYFVLDYRAPLKMPLAEADAQGRITRYYVWGTQGLLCHLDMNPTNGALLATRYYHADELGSTLALTDANGAVTDQFAYSPHGEVWGRTGSTDTPYQWLGSAAVRSEGAGLYFMLNRYYSASLRRFLSIDPSGIDSFPNLYAYGNLNSLFYTDPFGLEAKSYSTAKPTPVLSNYTPGYSSPRTYQAYQNSPQYLRDIDLTIGGQPTPVMAEFNANLYNNALLGSVGAAPRAITTAKSEITVFRQGTFADEALGWEGNAVKGKQWASDNPFTTPDYARSYGLPAENTGNPDWVVGGRTQGPYTTQPAPASHNYPLNTGGATEVLPQNVMLDWFHMP